MQRDRPAEPWSSFLTDLDAALDEPACFHCIGGFVVSQHYGFAGETADLDVLTVIPPDAARRVAELAGEGSPTLTLSASPNIRPTLSPVWSEYSRFGPRFGCLWAHEPHDLALTKLERSNDRDIRDVMYLAQAGLIIRETLISRFETELEPYITGRTPTWNRTTLKMWVDACWPE